MPVETGTSDQSGKRKQAPLLIGLPPREEERSLPRHHRSDIQDERCIDTIEYIRGVSKGPSQAARSLHRAKHVLWWVVFILVGRSPPGFAASTPTRVRATIQRSLLSLSFSSFLSPSHHKTIDHAATRPQPIACTLPDTTRHLPHPSAGFTASTACIHA